MEQTINPGEKQAEMLPENALVGGEKEHQGTLQKQARQKLFLQHYSENLFNVAATAREIGISRRTVTKWLEVDQDFKERMEEMRESRLDAVESVLYKKAVDGDTISCIFFLKCQGKSRGYVEQPNKQFLEISKGPDFDQQQLDALVRGQLTDRSKYTEMLGLES